MIITIVTDYDDNTHAWEHESLNTLKLFHLSIGLFV